MQLFIRPNQCHRPRAWQNALIVNTHIYTFTQKVDATWTQTNGMLHLIHSLLIESIQVIMNYRVCLSLFSEVCHRWRPRLSRHDSSTTGKVLAWLWGKLYPTYRMAECIFLCVYAKEWNHLFLVFCMSGHGCMLTKLSIWPSDNGLRYMHFLVKSLNDPLLMWNDLISIVQSCRGSHSRTKCTTPPRHQTGVIL